MSSLARRQFLEGSAILATASMSSMLHADSRVPDEAILKAIAPELRPAALEWLKRFGGTPFTIESLSVRRAAPPYGPPPRPEVPIRQVQVPGTKGQPDVSVYVINEKPGALRPVIVHMHGGGFMIGSAKAELSGLQDLAEDLDCAIVTVEYRLAPETTYAGSREDNYAALKWVWNSSPQLGFNREKIVVMGGSAGGGHAALLALLARDRGEVPIAFQCLVFPMLDDRTGSSRVPPRQVGHIVWTPQANRIGWRSFLGREPGGRNVPAQAVPARRTDLAGLPPTFIGVGTVDLFVDEDIEYARRLVEAGVPVRLETVPGAFHSFQNVARTTNMAKAFNSSIRTALRDAFRQVDQK